MDGHKRSAELERLEVVETGRRRRWSEDEKLKIVLESLQSPRAASSTARRYGISRSLLLNWRRSFRPVPGGTEDQQAGFVELPRRMLCRIHEGKQRHEESYH